MAGIAEIIGTVVLVAFVESASFAHSFDNWMVSIVVWISPWAGITIVEYFIVRRQEIDVAGLYLPPEESPYGGVNIAAVVALVLGLLAGLLSSSVCGPRCRGRSRRRLTTRTSPGSPGWWSVAGSTGCSAVRGCASR